MSHNCVFIIVSRKYLTACIVLVIIIYLISLSDTYHLEKVSTNLSSIPIIYDVIIDPGHGGVDPGGIGIDGVFEKDIVLDIALRLRTYLQRSGLKVGLTRDGDTDASNLAQSSGTRYEQDLNGRFIAMHGGIIGISIHANISTDDKEQGALVFFRRGYDNGQQYANLVFDQIKSIHEVNHHSPIPRSNLLLLKAKPPVILVEVGFLSNADDQLLLLESEFRQSLTEAIGRGVYEFFKLYHVEVIE